MKQQIIFIHGGEPDLGKDVYIEQLKKGRFEMNIHDSKRWYKNIRNFFDLDLYDVITPNMPCSEWARYGEWKIWFERHIEFMRDGVIFVGHSLGGNFLAKYLAENRLNKKIKQLHLVAASHSAFDDNFKITEFPKDFYDNSIDEIHIYHSKDDTVVPISESEKYHAQLPGSQLHIFEDRFHFLGETFPELFENIKKSSKNNKES